jgi:uncharacterized protein YprB with RNaseH-like and TPR domain
MVVWINTSLLLPGNGTELLVYTREIASCSLRYAIIWRSSGAGKAGSSLKLPSDAYLDIETTGLCSFYDEITVIGIYLVVDGTSNLVQLVGNEATRNNLVRALRSVDTIYTYNGSRFDLPFIDFRLRINLREHFRHHDLMHDCWRNNLYGGFKAVEQQLGIPRRLQGIGGAQAAMLWWRYQMDHDRKALDLLLEYNKEDVLNLLALRRKLARFPEPLY